MFAHEDIGPEQRRVLDEAEMAYQEKRHIAMAGQAMKATPTSEFNLIGARYEELNNRGRRIMERLAAVLNRLEGHPQEMINKSPSKESVPQGILGGFNLLLETHEHQSDVMEGILYRLEEII